MGRRHRDLIVHYSAMRLRVYIIRNIYGSERNYPTSEGREISPDAEVQAAIVRYTRACTRGLIKRDWLDNWRWLGETVERSLCFGERYIHMVK